MVEYAFLRQRGIGLLQQLCGKTYTDYNLHDPGVTILEALCYALTDLSYRTGFPIADLLADKDGKIPLQKNAFFVREEILSSNPVTVNDFRKFILDKNPSLHNAWLEPFMSGFSHGTMHGLYTMKIQVKKEFAPQVQQQDKAWVSHLKQQVRACFTSGRNLCEDLVRDIILLQPVTIKISASVVITGDQPELLLANIYRDLEAAINPPIKYYTAQELLEKGQRVEDLYAGPLLQKGFIPDDTLPPRRRTIDPAELMKVISMVPGVSYVRELVIVKPDGTTTDRAPFVLEEGACPYFDQDLNASPIRLLRGKYEVRIRPSIFNDIWPRVEEAARRSLEPVGDPYFGAGVRQGQYREIGVYRSIQHLFPVVYGIGPDGLGADPPPRRVAAVRQLKAYLLFFEQVMADYLAQLSNISGFFSGPPGSAISPGPAPHRADTAAPDRTYYHQPLYGVPGIRPLLRAFTTQANPGDDAAWNIFMADQNNGYIQSLQEGSETRQSYFERKNAVLDHLLARFNHQPSEYPVRLTARFYGSQYSQHIEEELLEWKAALLSNMVSLGYNRVRGGDYLQREKDDKGGFYNLIAALLYMRPQPASLSGAVLKELAVSPVDTGKDAGAAHPADDQQHKQEWATVADATAMRQLVPLRHATAPTHDDKWHFSHRKMSFFFHGLNAGNYTIGPDVRGGRGWLILYKEPDDDTWQVISRHPDEAGAASSLKKLIARLRPISALSEGFYVVEHVLLRPPVNADVFGFRFRTAKNEVLLQHSRLTGFLQREHMLEDILHAAETAPVTATPNASITEWGVKNLGGKCRIQLQRHKDLEFLSEPIDLEKWIWDEAAPDFEKARQQLLQFRENKLRFYPRFEMLVKGKDDNMIREEFYNFNMTIVLPAWPARFQDANFQTFVMDLFRMHTPAHIRIYFQWLNISHMREFESIYPNWIRALQQDDLAQRKHWSDEIVHFLKKGTY